METRRQDVAGTLLRRLLVSFGGAAFAAATFATPPVTVSPGGVDRVERSASACPTFSWGSEARVETWELVVHRLVDSAAPAEEQWREVLSVRLPGSISSWTPSLDDCLEAGETYAWFVGSAEDTWSSGRLFEVVEPPAGEIERLQALLAERRDLAAGGAGSRSEDRADNGAPPKLRPPSPTRKAAAGGGGGGTGFSVDSQGTAWGNAFILRCGSGAASEYFLDLDGDGYGDPVNPALACIQPAGYVVDSSDCNDGTSGINPGAAEVCDGTDTDCDGTIDGGLACDTGQPGVCTAGTEACADGSLVCQSDTPASAEVCDSLDNDCDGIPDEGNPGGGGACSTGLPGVCAAGTTTCSTGTIVCQQAVFPSPETCDGQDNDCDGNADEGNPGGGGACSTGLPGVCAAGTLLCSGASLTCAQNASQTAEICDGLDNDCDGIADEGNPGGGGACNTGLLGVCAEGTLLCTGASLSCAQNASQTAEICDGKDNDCNGIVDDGITCN